MSRSRRQRSGCLGTGAMQRILETHVCATSSSSRIPRSASEDTSSGPNLTGGFDGERDA
jgi:hypothetical protein